MSKLFVELTDATGQTVYIAVTWVEMVTQPRKQDFSYAPTVKAVVHFSGGSFEGVQESPKEAVRVLERKGVPDAGIEGVE